MVGRALRCKLLADTMYERVRVRGWLPTTFREGGILQVEVLHVVGGLNSARRNFKLSYRTSLLLGIGCSRSS